MKTRRNRRGGGPFSFFGSPTPPAPPVAPEAPSTPMQEGTNFLDKFKSVGKVVSNAVGIGNKNQLNTDFQTEINKLGTVFTEIDAFKASNPDKLPDVKKEVSDLGSLTGYSEAALINAIVIHNGAYKVRQLDNTLGSDCGPKCAERAKSIRLALRKLVEYSERSDALGYIGMGRGFVNNASYLTNSAVSGLQKGYNYAFTRKAPQETVAPQPEMPQPEQPQPPQPVPPVSGGRRRRTRRR